jgi:hypothetical protein
LGCGAPIIYGKNFCSSCGVIVAKDELIKSAKRGRIAAQSLEDIRRNVRNTASRL